MSKKSARTRTIYSKITPDLHNVLAAEAVRNNVSISTLVYLLLKREYWKVEIGKYAR